MLLKISVLNGRGRVARAVELQSNCSPRTPKHHVRAGETRNQRARRVNNLVNPTKSAKPPSPVQIRAAPPILNQHNLFLRRTNGPTLLVSNRASGAVSDRASAPISRRRARGGSASS